MPSIRTVRVATTGGDYTSLQQAVTNEAKDLVSLDRQLVILLESMTETITATNGIEFTGWTTDATRFVTVKATDSAYVDTSWKTSNVYLLRSNQSGIRNTGCPFLVLEGFQIEFSLADDNNFKGIFAAPTIPHLNINMRVRLNTRSRVFGSGLVGFDGGVDRSVYFNCINCVAEDVVTPNANNNYGFQVINHTVGVSRWYNCTSIDCDRGFGDGYNDVVIKNCIAIGGNVQFANSNGNAETLLFNAESTNNASTGASVPGVNPIPNTTFYQDPANGILNVTKNDINSSALARNAYRGGINLSGDPSLPFNYDILKLYRTNWSIGPVDATEQNFNNAQTSNQNLITYRQNSVRFTPTIISDYGLNFPFVTSPPNVSLNDLTAFTVFVLYRGSPSFTGFANLVGKRNHNAQSQGWILQLDGTSTNWYFVDDRVTTDTFVTTVGGVGIDPNKWYWIVVAYDSALTTGQINFYWAELGQPLSEIPKGTDTNGVGARVSDASQPLQIGVLETLPLRWNGAISVVAILNGKPTLSDINRSVSDIPNILSLDSSIFLRLGVHGSKTTVQDFSDNGFTATVISGSIVSAPNYFSSL